MHKSRLTRLLAAMSALALLATACGGEGDGDDEEPDGPAEESPDGEGDDEGGEGDEGDGEQATGGSFSLYGCEPEFLNTTDLREVCGGRVMAQLFTPLVDNDPETGEPTMTGVAESVESEDNVTWTIGIEEGWTFHDGEEITAETYVEAWNTVAQPGNANAGFFARFEGFEAVTNEEADELSGVEAVDDTTIEVTLTEPFGPFLATLSDTVFYPLPDDYYDDPEAFQDAPVGNGRYMMDGEWERGVEIALQKYEDWPGENPGNADAITYSIYSDINTAYLDVQAGNLDVLKEVPPENLGSVEQEFGENTQQFPTSSFTYLGFPMYTEEFGDNLELRQALSLAVDREAIIDAIFNGAYTPATAVIPPVLESHRSDACDVCEFDPERAQELFEEAGGFEGPMTLYFNSGAGHEEWVEAVSNQWTEVLGIEEFEFESLEFAQYLGLLEEQEVVGPYRLGWILSYLSPQYAMEDLYTSEGGSNYFGYANPEFDEALAEANATPPEEAASAYQAAEDILLEDLPMIPMWYGVDTAVWSDNVENVIVDPSGYVRAELIEVTGE